MKMITQNVKQAWSKFINTYKVLVHVLILMTSSFKLIESQDMVTAVMMNAAEACQQGYKSVHSIV